MDLMLWIILTVLLVAVITVRFPMSSLESDLEETMNLFDKCAILYTKQVTDAHISLTVLTGTQKVMGVNCDEIRWKFTLDGSLYAVEAK